MSSVLDVYVIYYNPKDYPHRYVLRRHVLRRENSYRIPNTRIRPDLEPLCVTDTIGEAYSFIPPGCVQLARDPKDDPCIQEVWV